MRQVKFVDFETENKPAKGIFHVDVSIAKVPPMVHMAPLPLPDTSTKIEDLYDKFTNPVAACLVKQLGGYGGTVPKEFLITKITKTLYGTYQVHYFDPKSKERTYRDLATGYDIKLLDNTKTLVETWETTCRNDLAKYGRRLVATLGTDPEIFAVDPHGEIVPAWMYLPDKENPLKYRTNYTGTAYWDGFQAEFTTQGSQTCLLQVSDNIQGGLQAVHNAASAIGAKITIDNVLPVNPDYLQNETIEHVQFGCAPSYNAYDLKGNIADGRNVPYRFAGGHLHFGISYLPTKQEQRQAIIEKYVKGLDKVLAVAVVSLLGELDNPIRRKFYGLPGEYRMPKHGFEYRPLSNAWLCHPLAMNMVFDLARSICGLAEEDLLNGWQCTEDEMKQIVIENDIVKAREVLDRNKNMFMQIVRVINSYCYTSAPNSEFAFKVWRNGIDTVVKDPKDIVSNWYLNGTGGTWITHGDAPGKSWYKSYETLTQGGKV